MAAREVGDADKYILFNSLLYTQMTDFSLLVL